MKNSKILIAPGEIRASLLDLFEDDREWSAFLSAAPGLLPGGFEGYAALARDPYARLSAAQAAAHRTAVLRFLAADVDRLPMNDEWWTRIQRWLDALRAGGPAFRYLPQQPVHTRLVSRPTETFVPGGPLLDGASELDLRLTGTAHEQARTWLTELFEDSEDITGEVERILAESWAGDLLSPEDLYFKVLAEYFEPMLGEMDIDADDNPLVAHLTDFQRSAYLAAKGILRRYGGVFLSDVVGLGKTHIALALISWLEGTLGQHAVVIGPPAVLQQWEALRGEFRLAFETVSMGKLEDLHKHSEREVFVIDESHNFRNESTLRYENLQSWIRPNGSVATRRVILLSATPQNNNPRDVQRQLQLFPDDHQRLPYTGESLDDFFRRIQNGQSKLSELLSHVLVRRTRRFIKENYPNVTIRLHRSGISEEIPLQFPKRVSGDEQCLRYRIDEAYGGRLYEDVMVTLQKLRYPLHSLFSYVRPEHQRDPRVAGLRRGTAIRGLFRVLLLKRLESSIHSFRISLARLGERLERALANLHNGSMVLAPDVETEVDSEGLDDFDEFKIEPGLLNVSELTAALEHDIDHVRTLAGRVQDEEGTDTKLLRLRDYLRLRPPTKHRTLIFTQFADTADYLLEQLGNEHGRTACASGRTGNIMKLARRFAPKAMREQVPESEQIDLLIATDVLSEGVNLQDADTLVNYDLHWNPVRLIQRAGRIDRIGSEHDEIHIASFMPERELEANLGLETVLRRRINEFLEVFGGDSAVLPSDELPDIEGALAAYTGAAFAQAEAADESDGMSRHFERLNAIREADPDRLERLRNMRPGKRAASTASTPAIAACRLGWHWTFYVWPGATDAEPLERDDLRGLDILYDHARAATTDSVPHEVFNELATQALQRFEPAAKLFRQQRARPQLSKPEQSLLQQLDEYALISPSTRRTLIDEIRQWILAGQQRTRLQRLGRRWAQSGLTPAAIFQELTALYRRFPTREEELGEVQLSGVAVGYGSSLDP